MENLLRIYLEKMKISNKSAQGLLKVSRNTLQRYKRMGDFLDLPLSAQIRILYYTDCSTIAEFEKYIKNVRYDENVSRILNTNGERLKNKYEMEKENSIKVFINGEIGLSDIARIGQNIKKEYPYLNEKKFQALINDDKRLASLAESIQTQLVITSDISSSYTRMLEDLLNRILKDGNDYNLLVELDRYIKRGAEND